MRVTYKNNSYNLPDFLIVGAAKSGTTSLHYYMKDVENIYLPEIKESYFFSFFSSPPNFTSPDPLFDIITDLQEYSKQYPEDFNGFLGDASPSYLYAYQKTISNIKEIYGDRYKDLKIIILLRNPVERAWSQYMHFKKNYNEPLEFGDAISSEVINKRLASNWNYFYDYIGFGKYTEQITAYQTEFNHVRIFLFDELKRDTAQVLNETLKFISGKEQRITVNTEEVFNISGVPKKNIYSFLWRFKKIKGLQSVIRKITPPKLKNQLNNFMLSRSLQRVKISDTDRENLKLIYKDEIDELMSVIKNPDIEKWL